MMYKYVSTRLVTVLQTVTHIKYLEYDKGQKPNLLTQQIKVDLQPQINHLLV